MSTYKYISADNHLNTPWLPKDLWQERLPRRLREAGPRVVETEKGSFWTWEGRVSKPSADGSSWRRLVVEEFSAVELEEGALPPSNPAIVLEHFDIAGIYAGIFYGDTRKWMIDDPELRLGVYRVYNDYCLELSAHAPERLIYLPNLPTGSPGACMEEFRRVADLGARAVEFDVCNAGAELDSEAWDPLWEEAVDRGVIVCSHTGHPAGTARSSRSGPRLAGYSASPFVAARPIADMVFGGVFERHPRLIWTMAESRIGWLPFLIYWMDRQLEIRTRECKYELSLPPSEYVRRNVRFTFEEDDIGTRLLAFEWSNLQETVMWGCDYPHPQEVWPDPDPKVDRMLEGIDTALRREILYGRAERLFGLKFPATSDRR